MKHKNVLILSLAILSLPLILSSCDNISTSNFSSSQEVNQSISFLENKDLLNFYINDETQLKVVNQNNEELNNVTFTSSDENIVSVSTTGLIKGKTEGSATITASLSDKEKATIEVTVQSFQTKLNNLFKNGYIASKGTYTTTTWTDIENPSNVTLNYELYSSATRAYIYEEYADDQSDSQSIQYVYKDSKVYTPYINHQNVLDYYELDFTLEETTNYFSNEFKNLKAKDFTKNDDNSFTINFENLSYNTNALAVNFTGFSTDALESLTFYLENGEIASYKATTVPGIDDYFGINYQYSFDGSLLSNVDDTKYNPVPYETEDNHEALAAALNELKTSSFTATVKTDDSWGVVSYETTYIYTSNLTYCENIDLDLHYGYYQNENGLHYFEMENNVPTAKDYPSKEETVSNYRPSFDIKPELFTYVDNNTYQLVDNNFTTLFLSYFNPDFFGDKGYFALSNSVFVTINENHLSEIKFEYENESLAGTVVITIENIATTQNPFTDEEFVEYFVPTSWEEYDYDSAMALSEFLGTDCSIIPFYLPEEGYSRFEEDYMTPNFLIESSYIENGEKYYNEYTQILLDNNWTFVEEVTNDWGAKGKIYSKDNFKVQVMWEDFYGSQFFYIYVLPPVAA